MLLTDQTDCPYPRVQVARALQHTTDAHQLYTSGFLELYAGAPLLIYWPDERYSPCTLQPGHIYPAATHRRHFPGDVPVHYPLPLAQQRKLERYLQSQGYYRNATD